MAAQAPSTGTHKAMAGTGSTAKRPRWAWLFLPFFGVYTGVAAVLLALGLLPQVILISPWLHNQLHATSLGDGLWSAAAGAILSPVHNHVVSGAWALLRDYFFSLLNLAVGVFLVWRRPHDWVARLLGMGMVGTGLVYNFYAHEVIFALYPALSWVSAIHVIYHGLAPAGYLHAIALFPDGRVVPKWLRKVIPAAYGAMAIFIGMNVYTYIASPVAIEFFESRGVNQESLSLFAEINIIIDIALIGVFFGVATPLIGVLSQRYRARERRTAQERQQAAWVIWALCLSSSVALVILLAAAALVFSAQGFTAAAWHRLEGITMQVLPPVFALVPIALFVAIVRHRLFDIELLINRTMVYVPLTAALGAMIPLAFEGSTFMFSSVLGEGQSEMVILVAGLLVWGAVGFMKGKLQKLADRHFMPKPDPTKRLAEFGAHVRSVVQVMDGSHIAASLLEEAAGALGADRGAVTLQLQGSSCVVATRGAWDGVAALQVPLAWKGAAVGTLCVGPKTSGAAYTAQEAAAVAQAAEAVAQGISLLGEEQRRSMAGR